MPFLYFTSGVERHYTSPLSAVDTLPPFLRTRTLLQYNDQPLSRAAQYYIYTAVTMLINERVTYRSQLNEVNPDKKTT